jgi:hypothetical protein
MTTSRFRDDKDLNMNQGPDPFLFFSGIGVLIFLSCCGYALVRYMKHSFPANMHPWWKA